MHGNACRFGCRRELGALRAGTRQHHREVDRLTRGDHKVETLVRHETGGTENELRRQAFQHGLIRAIQSLAPVRDGLQQFHPDGRVDHRRVLPPGRTNSVTNERTVRREHRPVSSASRIQTLEHRCRRTHQRVVATLIQFGSPDIARRSVHVDELARTARLHPTPHVVCEQVRTDEHEVPVRHVRTRPGRRHERHGRRFASPQRRSRHPRLGHISALETLGGVVPEAMDVGIRKRARHGLEDVLGAAAFGDPLMHQQPGHQCASAPGITTAFTVRHRMTRSPTSDQFST